MLLYEITRKKLVLLGNEPTCHSLRRKNKEGVVWLQVGYRFFATCRKRGLKASHALELLFNGKPPELKPDKIVQAFATQPGTSASALENVKLFLREP
jgi:hypothetical protein